MKFENFERECLGKGWRGRLWFWRKKRQILDDRNFVSDFDEVKRILAEGERRMLICDKIREVLG